MPRKWPNEKKEEFSREDLKNILNETIKEKDLTREWKKMFLSLVLSDLVENGYLTSNRKDKLQRNLKKYVSGGDKKRKNDETKNIKKPELSKKIQIWEKETEISKQEYENIKTEILDAMEKKDKKNKKTVLKVAAVVALTTLLGRGGYEAYDYLKNKSDENSDTPKTEETTNDTTAEIVKTVDEIEGNDTLPNDRNNNTQAYTETDDDDPFDISGMDFSVSSTELDEKKKIRDQNNTTISNIDEETAKVNAEIEKLQVEKED